MNDPAPQHRFIVSATSKVHIEISPSLLDLVVTDGRGTFNWLDGPLCGSESTTGYALVGKGDDRPLCKTCVHRYQRLMFLYEQHLSTETEKT